MKDTLWSKANGTGRAPRAVGRAAEDLVVLYEDLNGTSIVQLFHRLRDVTSSADTDGYDEEVAGHFLAAWAVGMERNMSVAHAARVRVPEFSISLERDELVWEGGDEREFVRDLDLHENPRKAGVDVLLIEPDEKYVTVAKKLIKGLWPSAKVTVVDNAMSAIGNIDTHDYQLVVSEVSLLGQSTGLDVLNHVRARHQLLASKFVFFTNDERAASQRCLAKRRDVVAHDLKKALYGEHPGPSVRTLMPMSSVPSRTAAPPPRSVAPRRAPAPALEPLSDVEMSALLRQVLPTIPGSDRFGPEKVFVVAAWRAVREASERARNLTLEDFKSQLVSMLRNSLVLLARADLVGAMPPHLVAQSEIEDIGATFHFIIDQDAVLPGTRAHGPRSTHRPAKPLDDVEMSEVLKHVLPKIHGRDRFGTEKVFIVSAWNAVRDASPRAKDLSLVDFKSQLVNMNREQLIDIVRADLVGAMPADLVSMSEIEDLGATFHFIIDRSAVHRRPHYQ